MPLSCATVNQIFLQETGRIGPDAYQRGRERDPVWLGLVPQKQWHGEMGRIINDTVFERSGITAPPTWQVVADSNGTTNACLPPVTEINSARTLNQYQLSQVALQSEPICLTDIADSNNPKRQVAALQRNLMDNANYVRKERVRSEYERLATHKIVVAPGLPEDSVGFPLIKPTSQMTLEVLRSKYFNLLRDSDGTEAVGRTKTTGAPVFVVIGSGEMIENAVKSDSDIRQDFRWSERVKDLLGPFAPEERFAYGGFVFQQDSFPPRYNDLGADFIRVPEYIGGVATIGTRLTVSPAWLNAQYEVTYIFHESVMASRVPMRPTSYGDVVYKATNYALEWKWLNILDRDCNPDGTIGFFRALGQHASEPILPEFGYCFLALNCKIPLNLVACASGSGYTSSNVPYSGPDAVGP